MISICKHWKNIALSVVLAGGMGAFSTLAHAQSYSRSMVRSAQQQLKTSGYYTGALDGIDGPMTQAAIRKYQMANNLTVNGQLDRETRADLGLQSTAEANRSETGTSGAPALPSATVSAAQRSLQQKGFYKGDINGALTPETQAAIREYQKNSNLNVTGQLDQATLSSLGVSK